ncbi:L-xylulose reductase [Folsomia candida]|uniref:L-xylulose reductase n=1 Tax=Folsomia candida TaxID=158441 RepID=A0A226F7E4_FOLCA|nr:L-xylulose reductase [Folsomia candida]
MFQQYFQGKRVLITGVGRGIGRSIAKRLASYGAHVTGLSKTEELLNTLKLECPEIETIAIDLEDWDATRNALLSLDPFDFLVNNAAIFIPGLIMSVNVGACINVAQVVAEGMEKSDIAGSIVNISSLGSTSPFPAASLYCLSKAALDMLTKLMAVELGPKKIRVNSINQVGVDTDMYKQFYQTCSNNAGLDADEYLSQLDARIPVRNFLMEMDHIVNAVLFMLSPSSPHIHGEMLFVDGGIRHT